MTYELVFWMMLATWGCSLAYPWHPSWPLAKLLVHLPWVLIPLYILYEVLMPSGMNIRIDLLLIYPALVGAFVVYVSRLVAYATLRRRTDRDSV